MGFLISGIIRNELTDVVRKVPLLGDIPLLGLIFQSREKTNKATELFVFITPVVIDNTEDATQLNSPYKQWLEEQAKSLGAATGPVPTPVEKPPAKERNPGKDAPEQKPATPDQDKPNASADTAKPPAAGGNG